MKVVHVPYTYAPDPIGGTEVYVGGLVQELHARGIEGVVVAAGRANERYEVNHVAVRRIRVSDSLSLTDLYGEGDAQAAKTFGEVLDEICPDVVHFHAYSSGSSLRMLREARGRQLPTVFTYHTPTVTCQRGTLLEFGRSVCDGRMEAVRCTRCMLHGRGLSRVVAEGLARLPRFIQAPLSRHGLSGGVWTALRMRELVELRQSTVRAVLDAFDRIVVPAAWVRALLVRNGVPQGKLFVSRQGVGAYQGSVRPSRGNGCGALKLVWLGRLDPTKGLDVLVAAFALSPDLNAKLDAYGIFESGNESQYAQKLRISISRDPRIRLLPSVASQEVPDLLREYCALLVPSQCLETGPLVVLEAYAAALPVIGSGFGGIAELIEDGKTGILVDSNSARAWAAVLRRVAADRSILADLAVRAPRPKLMREVAAEMHSLYDELLSARSEA